MMLDSPPEFYDADDCVLERSEKLTRGKGNKPVLSWMFYIDGQIVLELPVRMVQVKPVAVSAAERVENDE